jgi:hypothetical protein
VDDPVLADLAQKQRYELDYDRRLEIARQVHTLPGDHTYSSPAVSPSDEHTPPMAAQLGRQYPLVAVLLGLPADASALHRRYRPRGAWWHARQRGHVGRALRQAGPKGIA